MSNSAFTVTGSATGTGTVTSVGLSSSDGLLSFANSPITTSGSIAITVNTLGVAVGAVGLTTYNQGDMIYASAANTLAALAKDTNATRYLSNTGASNAPAWAQVNLANGVTGNLAVTHLNSGTAAGATTFWRGDGSWAVPAGSGGTVTSVTASSPLASSGGATPDISLSGIVGLTHGGTNASLTASNGGLVYSTASALAILAGTATANQVPLSGSNTAPAWSTATYLPTLVANEIVYASATNTMAQITTAANSVLATDGSGVPSLTTSLPAAVQVGVNSLNHGTGAAANTFWAGDGSWKTVAGGSGNFQFVNQVNAASSPSISFALNNSYLIYKIYLTNVLVSTNDAYINLTFNNDSSASYDFAWIAWTSSGAGPTNSDFAANSTSINLSNDFSNTMSANGEITIFNPSGTDITMVEWKLNIYNGFANAFVVSNGGGAFKKLAGVTSVQLTPSTGTITSGAFTLYGLNT